MRPMLFFHSSVKGHFGCFYFGATMDKGARNMYKSLREHIFLFHLSEYLGVPIKFLGVPI